MDELERSARLEALFAEHAAAVRAYALRRIGAEAVDDTVSEVFVVACRRLEHVPADALPWLLACARRVLANQRRGARRRDALLDRLYGQPAPAAAPRELQAGGSALLTALAALRESDREVLLLVAWEGLEPARAAAALECSRPAFAARLHRARRRLAHALERAERGDSPRPTPTEAVR